MGIITVKSYATTHIPLTFPSISFQRLLLLLTAFGNISVAFHLTLQADDLEMENNKNDTQINKERMPNDDYA